MAVEKRTVITAKLENELVKYQAIDDCYICAYNPGDKFKAHICLLTGEYLHPGGRIDIDIPESCPFPSIGSTIEIEAGIITRYPGINHENLSEIIRHIKCR